MQVLENAGQEVQHYLELVQLLEKLRADKPDAQSVVKALLDYANDPTKGDVATIVTALHLDGTKLQSWINAHKSQLTFLSESVGDLAGKSITWSLEDKGAVAAGAFSIDVGADVSASITGNDSGDLFGDGSVTFDKTANAYLEFEVDGKVSAGTNVPSLPVGAFTGSGAFSASAEVTAGAYFEHPVNTLLVDAIISDVRRFRLPLDPAPLAPGEYLRLNGKGSVAISGSLAWGKTIVATGAVSSDALNLQAIPIEADVQAGASVGFNAAMEGDFNIVVSAADDGRRRVQLVQSQTISSGTDIEAGVSVTIKGADKVASALLAQITTPLQPLIALLTADTAKFGQLHDLFTKELTTEVDNLLNDAGVLNQIQAWLTMIGSDVNLKANLSTAIVNAVDAKAGPVVDKVNTAMQPVVDLVKQLIKKYQDALTKLNAAVKAAAQVKVGIAFSRKRTSTDTSKVALSIVIDPAAQKDAYLHLLYGDFTEALDLARNNAAGVTLENATWSDKGSTTIATSFNVSAFGDNVGVGSLLQQDWQWQLTANGDLNLGVSTSLTSWAQGWGVLRSVTFLADTQVLAKVSSANVLVDPNVQTTATIDVAEESTKFTRTDLENWQQRMIGLGVLAAPTTMLDDAAVAAGDPNPPYGDLTRTAEADFTDAQILAIAKSDSFTARKVFASALVDQYDGRDPFNMRDAKGVPLAAWEWVQAWALGGRQPADVPPSMAVPDDAGVAHSVNVRTYELNYIGLMVKEFDAMITRLRDLAASGSLAGSTVKDALAEIRAEQSRIFDNVEKILGFDVTKNRENVGFAFFVTMWNLAGGQSAVDPYAVLARSGKRWVYK